MAKASKCPVCDGRGLVPGGFYNGAGPAAISATATEACRSCKGTGYLVLPEGKEEKKKARMLING